MSQLVIEVGNSEEVRRALAALASPDAVRVVVKAAGQEVRAGALEHFRAREQEPERTDGFPKFGEPFGKRGFWSGNKGTSVAEAVGPAVFDAADSSVTIRIDSPALAHKADPDPQPITPKGGRRYLAIPANARAAMWARMPRDFTGSGPMTFAYSLTPEGRWMKALVAKENFLRVVARGKRAGQRVVAAAGKATAGIGEPQYWLVRSVKTRHDPRAMPDQGVLTVRANARAEAVLAHLSR